MPVPAHLAAHKQALAPRDFLRASVHSTQRQTPRTRLRVLSWACGAAGRPAARAEAGAAGRAGGLRRQGGAPCDRWAARQAPAAPPAHARMAAGDERDLHRPHLRRWRPSRRQPEWHGASGALIGSERQARLVDATVQASGKGSTMQTLQVGTLSNRAPCRRCSRRRPGRPPGARSGRPCRTRRRRWARRRQRPRPARGAYRPPARREAFKQTQHGCRTHVLRISQFKHSGKSEVRSVTQAATIGHRATPAQRRMLLRVPPLPGAPAAAARCRCRPPRCRRTPRAPSQAPRAPPHPAAASAAAAAPAAPRARRAPPGSRPARRPGRPRRRRRRRAARPARAHGARARA